MAWRHDIIYLFCTILPPSSHYLSFLESVCARVESRGTECFCGTAFGLQWEQQAHRGVKLQLSLHCSSRWSASQPTAEFECPPPHPPKPTAVHELESSPPSPWWLQSITSVFSVTELEVRGAIPWSLEGGGGLPRHGCTHAGRLPGSSLSHFMSTQSVIQTLHKVVSVPCKRSRLAKISATCRSHPHCYQLQRGWTGSARGQSQLWLVLLGCRADGGSLNRLLSDVCRVVRKKCSYRFSWA